MNAEELFIDLHSIVPRPDARGVFWATMEGGYDFVAGVSRAEVVPDRPVNVVWSGSTRKPGALIGTTYGSPLIVRDDIASAMESERLTGWRTYPVLVVGPTGEVHSNYRGIAVTGRHGPADRSGLKLLRVDNGVNTYVGAKYRRAEWDGSDFAVRSASGFIGIEATPRATAIMTRLCGRELHTRSIADRHYTDADLKFTT